MSNASKNYQPTAALARRYWETHGGQLSPLLGLRRWVKEHGQPSEEDLSQLAIDLKIPVSTLRGVATFYGSLATNESTIRVCNGTACYLAGGGAALAGKLSGRVEPSACLGYCHRAPALLDGKGAPFAAGDELDQLVAGGKGVSDAVFGYPLPDFYCASERPILLEQEDEPWQVWQTMVAEHSPSELLQKIGDPQLDECAGAVSSSGERYLIAHAHHGEEGNFSARLMLEADPYALLAGMAIVSYAIGASAAIIYVPYEYPHALTTLAQAIREMPDTGMEISLYPSPGNEPTGDDSAMLSAIEGLRAEPRIQPPSLTSFGLYGAPTAILDIESLVSIEKVGRLDSGTRLISAGKGFQRTGLVEVDADMTVAELIKFIGGPTEELAAVLVGGMHGSLLVPDEWETAIFEKHGGLTAIPKSTDLNALLGNWLVRFESGACGKCIPCSLGSQRAMQIFNVPDTEENPVRAVENVLQLSAKTSLCAFGKELPRTLLRLIELMSI